MLKPNEKLKNPRLTFTVSKPTFNALKKKFLTGPLGNTPVRTKDNAEPIIPPITMPKTIFAIFLLAISPPSYLAAKFGYAQIRLIKHIKNG